MSEHQYKHINLEYLYEIADNEIGFVKEIINDYIDKIPSQVKDLNAAFARNDLSQTAFIAHKLKSSFQFMGADELIHYAQEIETLSKQSAEEMIGLKLKAMISVVDLVLEELQHKLSTLS